MWFSGLKYRRTRCENLDELLTASNANENIARIIKCKPPVICFTAIDSKTMKLDLEVDGKSILTYEFKLGEEQEMEKRDGTKVKMTYTLEGENTLKQVIKMQDGKTAHFTREFKDNDVKMTITIDGTDVTGTIYYEIVQ